MLTRIWTSFLFSLIGVATIAWLVALMHEKDIRPVRDLAGFFKKRPKSGRVFLGTFFLAMWIIASVKPGGGNVGGGGDGGGDGGNTNNVQMVIGSGGGLQPLVTPGAVTNSQQQGLQGGILPPQGGLVGDPAPVTDQWTDFTPITSTNTTWTLDGDDFRRGFVMTRIGTGEAFDFAAPSNSTVCADWEAFGAAEDWMYLALDNWTATLGTNEVNRFRVYSFGKAQPCVTNEVGSLATNRWFAPFCTVLGIVPQANWPMIAGGVSSRFWHFVTPSNTLQMTWQNALLGRATNTPVNVQMELWPSGRFVYRYDLSRLDAEEITNVLVGASFVGIAWTTNSLPTNVTTMAFYPLSAEDAIDSDRDGDGLSLLDELFFHGTDPDLWDTDFDGVSDGAEVASGMNPLVRDSDGDGFLDGTDFRPAMADEWTDADDDGLPDAWKEGWFRTNATVAASGDANADGVSNIASLLMGLNPIAPPTDGFACAHGGRVREINAWEISPVPFSFRRPAGLTNVVSRTFTVRRESPWEQFFVSSRPDVAEGWDSADVAILYGLGGEPATNAVPDYSGDSWRIPLGDTMPQSVSIRILVTGDAPYLSAPLYLLRWTPRVEFLPSANVTIVDATNGCTYAAAKRNPDNGVYEVPFRADVSKLPHRAGIDADVAADLAMPPAEYVSVSEGTPRVFTASDPLVCDLPREGTNLPKRLLFYSIDISRTGAVSSGPRSSQYASPYPLSSSSLRKSFHAATGETADGSVTLTLSPDVPELGYTTGLPVLRGRLRLMGASVGGLKAGTVMPPATVTPTVFDDPCTNDTYEVEQEYPEDHDETHDEDDDPDDDDDCKCCGDGGSSLGSFRIRIPFGESASDERLGYLWTIVDGPTAITPSAFGVLAAQGVSVATNAKQTLSISCASAGGKTLMVTNIAHGVAIPVWNASGRFESEWQVWNEDGDISRIRVRRMTVAGNATVDETYATWTEVDPVVFWETRVSATVWEKADNIRGVTKRRYEWRDLEESDFTAVEYDETYLDGNLVRAEERTYAKIGEGSTARRRLVRTYGYDENGWHETVRTYWCDTDHPDRHARLKSVRSDRQPWAYVDYDASGRETVRVEQMDGSSFPEIAEVSLDAVLPQWCSAKVTVTGYATQDGDDAHRNDSFEPRETSVYVRRGGDAPILVSHETRIYKREADAFGNPLRRIMKTVGFGGLTRTETTVEYPQDNAVPSHLRGLRTLVSNADGSVTSTSHSLSNGCLVATAHTTFNGVERLTYARTVTDAAYRLPLREETRLSSDGALLEWSERTYDDIRRLRSVSYSDGSSETNAYSCCRLLWRRDRQGRKVLRSAQTGTDSLYYADEDVWLSDVSTNGAYRIVRHFFDGFGRETETVTHIGSTPGEATVPYEPSADQMPFSMTVEYFDDSQNGTSERIDERGKVVYGSSWRQASAEQTGESIYGTDGWSDALTTSVTRYRNGGTATERWWSGGWRREETAVTYDESGRRIDTETVSASDHATVTNSVTQMDALGRLASVWTPTGTTTFIYDGASSRLLRMDFIAGDVARTTYVLHNSAGEQTGTVLDGVTNRTDVAYVKISNVWWRVTTSSVTGPETNSATIVREQMSGLGGELRGRTVSVDAAGLVSCSARTFDDDTGIETEIETTSDGTWKVVRRRHGFVLGTETAAGRTVNAYDGFGRMVGVRRSVGADGEPLLVSRTEYTPWGDVMAVETFTNGTETVRESYGYDAFGNRTTVTNALGEVVESNFDVFGNVTAMRGATYPVEMDYDTENRCVALRTTRDGLTWDETRWTHDATTGNCTVKTYADGSQVTYTYTPDALPLRTTYASGEWTENVYDSRRQIAGVTSSDGVLDVDYEHDAYGRIIVASNAVALTSYSLNQGGTATNETRVLDGDSISIIRAVDALNRPIALSMPAIGYEMARLYSTNGLLAAISNSDAIVTYLYAPDRLDSGYSILLAVGGVHIRESRRNPFRRELTASVTNAFGLSAHGLAYSYDALSRPVSRNADLFTYNTRGEVVGATIGGEQETHTYDLIGNSALAAFNAATNTYVANSVNQYVSAAGDIRPCAAMTYGADGSLLSDGYLAYTYDSASRLASVSSNGTDVVVNQYDHMGRRVRKVTAASEIGFLYDGWNLIYEREVAGSVTNETFYYWGKDISGGLQGAGGIGGLLYLKRNGTIYVPHHDAYGNIVRYVDSTGNVAAEYIYDAFGGTISASGPLADVFRIRYSSKYYDAETGLYYYGYRFYSPILRRWLTRDPKEEDGDFNLYGFCRNNPVSNIDPHGEDIYLYTGNNSGNPLNDAVHQTVAVDIWSDDCPPKKTGVRGFSFGYDGEWGWNWPNGKWLGHSSITLPGYWMVGEIYEAPVVGKIVSTKKTTPEQDKAWLQNMESRVGTKDVYSVGRHNCRAFSQAEFNKAP